MIFLLMINGCMMKYVDFFAVVVQPYSQIVILRPEGAAVYSPGQRPGLVEVVNAPRWGKSVTPYFG